MLDQLDLFGAPPPQPPPAAAVQAPEPWRPNIHLYPPKPAQRLPGVSAASIAALADIVLLDELPPVVPGASPRVAVNRAGWDRAMAHRMDLTHRQLGGTITPGDAEALAALRYVELQQVDGWNTGPVIITANGYEHAANALAGLCCAAQEHQDG